MLDLPGKENSLVKGRNGKQDVLRLYSVADIYRFYYGLAEGECLPAGELPAYLLSSAVNEGFTGVYIGMYATANGQESANAAYYDWFLYEI